MTPILIELHCGISTRNCLGGRPAFPAQPYWMEVIKTWTKVSVVNHFILSSHHLNKEVFCSKAAELSPPLFLCGMTSVLTSILVSYACCRQTHFWAVWNFGSVPIFTTILMLFWWYTSIIMQIIYRQTRQADGRTDVLTYRQRVIAYFNVCLFFYPPVFSVFSL